MDVRRGVIKGFNSGTYKAQVQVEGNPQYVDGVPVSRGIPSGEVVTGRSCAVLFFDVNHSEDAMVLGVY